ncbi:MAG: nucleotidyltransferase domain-containing protein [Nitrospiraceae bacterium]|nr:nucleotidyltransferase domain-containing protein [Nitrospiraceae bacterium]
MKALSKKELQATLAAVVKRLVENLDVEKIVLFGSYVKGAPTKDSDLDLLVMLNTKKKGIERYAMVSEVLEPRTIPMDIIVRTPAEIKKREHYFDPFIKSIMTEGKVLYEKAA